LPGHDPGSSLSTWILGPGPYQRARPSLRIGGILVRSRRCGQLAGAEWRAHLAAPGRACLECLGQYDPAMVTVERAGLLDDPSYLAGLIKDHPARRNEHAFSFSAAAAAAAAETLQLLSAVIAPGGVSDVGAHLYHFTTGTLDRRTDGCRPGCPYAESLPTLGDAQPFDVTGKHWAAATATARRRTAARRPAMKLARKMDDFSAGCCEIGARRRRAFPLACPPSDPAGTPCHRRPLHGATECRQHTTRTTVHDP
jgi:hypothetical protein